MKNLYLSFILIIGMFLTSSCNKNFSSMPITPNNVQEQYIIVLEPSINILNSGGSFDIASASKSILEANGINNSSIVALYDKVLTGFCAKLTVSQVNTLRLDKRISLIEKDQQFEIQGKLDIVNLKDPSNTIQYQSLPWGVRFIGGFVNATSSTGVAWIVDTGIQFTHPDLNVNTSLSKSFVAAEPSADDRNGHGTHVAGTVGAINNTIGVVGICAGTPLIAIKVLNSTGNGRTSDIISGFNYIASNLVQNKTNVVNCSFGGTTSTTMDAAVTNLANAGAYIVMSAGNSQRSAGLYSPGRTNGNRIYTIAAYTTQSIFAVFSNWGNGIVDYITPGMSINSTYKDSRYGTMTGTSMAAPHLTGILVANNGIINTNGTVKGGPDSTSYPKACR